MTSSLDVIDFSMYTSTTFSSFFRDAVLKSRDWYEDIWLCHLVKRSQYIQESSLLCLT